MTGPVIRRRLARVGRRGVRRIAPALALLSLCLSAEAQPPEILSSAYEAAIAAYGAGDREKAVSEAAAWRWRSALASTNAAYPPS